MTKSTTDNSQIKASDKADDLEQLTEMTKTCEGMSLPRSMDRKAHKSTTNNKPTKAELILKRLRSKRGASLDELSKATGWQLHSVRGFLSGTVRKRMGLSVEAETSKSGIRRYRIIENAGAARAGGARQ